MLPMFVSVAITPWITVITPLIIATINFLMSLFDTVYVDNTLRSEDESLKKLEQLLEDIEVAGVYGESSLSEFTRRARDIPSPRYTLIILHHMSHNEAVEALGIDRQYRIPNIPEKLTRLQRIFAPFFDLPPKPTIESELEQNVPIRR
jgi:hypothetical protein